MVERSPFVAGSMATSVPADAGGGWTPSKRALQIFPAAASAKAAVSCPAPAPQQELPNRPLSWLASYTMREVTLTSRRPAFSSPRTYSSSLIAPARHPVQAERLADAALGGLDRAVHLVGGQPDKARREVRQQP